MDHQKYLHVLSERGQLLRMLEEIPEEDILDRMSVEGRLLSVEAELAEMSISSKVQE